MLFSFLFFTEFESASFIYDIFINKSKIVKKSFEKLLKEKRNTVKCEFLSLCACSVIGKFKICLNRHWASQDRRL